MKKNRERVESKENSSIVLGRCVVLKNKNTLLSCYREKTNVPLSFLEEKIPWNLKAHTHNKGLLPFLMLGKKTLTNEIYRLLLEIKNAKFCFCANRELLSVI